MFDSLFPLCMVWMFWDWNKWPSTCMWLHTFFFPCKGSCLSWFLMHHVGLEPVCFWGCYWTEHCNVLMQCRLRVEPSASVLIMHRETVSLRLQDVLCGSFLSCECIQKTFHMIWFVWFPKVDPKGISRACFWMDLWTWEMPNKWVMVKLTFRSQY